MQYCLSIVFVLSFCLLCVFSNFLVSPLQETGSVFNRRKSIVHSKPFVFTLISTIPFQVIVVQKGWRGGEEPVGKKTCSIGPAQSCKILCLSLGLECFCVGLIYFGLRILFQIGFKNQVSLKEKKEERKNKAWGEGFIMWICMFSIECYKKKQPTCDQWISHVIILVFHM